MSKNIVNIVAIIGTLGTISFVVLLVATSALSPKRDDHDRRNLLHNYYGEDILVKIEFKVPILVKSVRKDGSLFALTTYVNNIKSGPQILFYKDGAIMAIQNWNDDKLDGACFIYEDYGEVICAGEYINGIPNEGLFIKQWPLDLDEKYAVNPDMPLGYSLLMSNDIQRYRNGVEIDPPSIGTGKEGKED